MKLNFTLKHVLFLLIFSLAFPVFVQPQKNTKLDQQENSEKQVTLVTPSKLATPVTQVTSVTPATIVQNDTFLWQTVLSGKVLSEPALLSYGFCVITDAKKINCLSYIGVKLWEKAVIFPRTARAFSLSDDFLLLYQKNPGKISLLNPCGLSLWENSFSYDCKGVLPLWDGRFLIFGDSYVACYGINGIKKWQVDFSPEAKIKNDEYFPPQIDNDGYIYFHCSDDKLNAVKLSPFGSAEKCSFSFFDSTQKGKKELEERLVKEIFPREKITTAFLTPELELVLCKEDWNIELYSVLPQQDKKKYSYLFSKNNEKSYKSFYNLNQIYSIITNNDEISDEVRLQKLSQGNYAQNELVYASEALNVLQSYQKEINMTQFGSGVIYSDYEANAKDFEIVIKQIPLFASYDFSKVSSGYILNTKNYAVLKLILNAVSSCGYDPDLHILDAIQARSKTISYKNEEILCAMCDAVYEICRFMGRAAYYKRGRLILTDFLSSQNTNRVKAYARKTFAKIKLLEL